MDYQLVIKFSEITGAPIGIVESPPILYSNFKQLFPNESFSTTAIASEVEPHGYGVFEWNYPPENLSYTKSCDAIGLTRNTDGIWRETFIERDATLDEINQRTQQKAQEMRVERNFLLSETDYTQLPDCALSVAKVQEFALYRQALRDVTTSPGFPWDFNFPSKP